MRMIALVYTDNSATYVAGFYIRMLWMSAGVMDPGNMFHPHFHHSLMRWQEPTNNIHKTCVSGCVGRNTVYNCAEHAHRHLSCLLIFVVGGILSQEEV